MFDIYFIYVFSIIIKFENCLKIMMKFTSALILFSAIMTIDKMFARAEGEEAGEAKEVEYEKYWKASADWDKNKTPLNEYYKYEEGSDGLKCAAI